MASGVLEPGFRVGKYEVVAHVATGGMGTVYKAVDLDLRRTVGLKILSVQLAENQVLMERFRREARHAARLSHPNIVTLFEFNHDADLGLYYLALEFIDGIDLAEYLAQKGRLQPEEVRRIMLQTAKALEHAFEHGVVHRDIKPSNLMLARDGKKRLSVKLTDLGLAIATNEDEYRVTREGNTVGTIDYMSPEQARDSRSVDIRSDIYSLGCTAFHLLAGRAPFAEGGLGERLCKHMEMAPPDVRTFNPAVSLGFWAVLQKMLAKNPEDRYQTPGEFRRVLKSVSAQDAKKEAPELNVGRGRRKTERSSSEPTRLSLPASGREPRAKKAAVKPDSGPHVGGSPSVTQEQVRAAAAFHERAVQVLGEGGGESYARQLLDNCLKLDPYNITHRQTLRDMNRRASGGMLGRWFGSLNVLAIKSKMRLARTSSDWPKVIELGEQVLAYQRGDVDAHLGLAEAAEALEFIPLAQWFLQQGRGEVPENADLMRAQARLFEKLNDLKQAITLWEKVSELDPSDREAHNKINDLSAQDLMARNRYHQ